MSDIAIYEENDLMRALLQEWLGAAGHRVHAAESLDMLHGSSPLDLVIVNVGGELPTGFLAKSGISLKKHLGEELQKPKHKGGIVAMARRGLAPEASRGERRCGDDRRRRARRRPGPVPGPRRERTCRGGA